MIRDKKITFRVSEAEYNEIMVKKPTSETLSQYIRKLLLVEVHQ